MSEQTKVAPLAIKGVAQIVAVASGKGGVGKSTIATNLAVALKASGRRVGLLDADIYGPSQGTLFGLASGTKPEVVDQQLVPILAHGVH
ncbi:MAG: P-loop NTPase, partial [Gammaproteobacteria bacterium]|nr:P-loop NTPase [Gammaproteobacteria bacterium]